MTARLTFLPPTRRSHMSRTRAAKIFLSRNGVCWNCRQQIRGEKWTVEHPDALALAGSDDDADLWPIHLTKCRKEKDALDAAAIAKRNRLITASYVPPDRPVSKWKRKLPSKRNPFPHTILRGQQ